MIESEVSDYYFEPNKTNNIFNSMNQYPSNTVNQFYNNNNNHLN